MPLPIAFRETIRRSAVGERKYIRYFDRRGHFAHLKVLLRPADLLNIDTTEDARKLIPEECCVAALQSLKKCVERGPVRGFPLRNLEVLLIGGSFLERYSYPEAFAYAAHMAFDDAMQHAEPVVTEPWVGVNVFLRNAILSDLVRVIRNTGEDLELSFRTIDPSIVRIFLPRRILPELSRRFSSQELLIAPLVNPGLEYHPVRADFRWDKLDLSSFESWT